MVKNDAYLLVLHSINGLGPIRLKALLDYFKDPKLVWEATLEQMLQIGIPRSVADSLIETRKKLDPQKYFEDIQKSGIKILTIFDKNYPKLLKEIYDPPVVLFYKGEIWESDEKAIAVVGTRKITGYGKLVTEKFTAGLVDLGMTIVSGLARGVDSEAHRTTIKKKGRTLAVLGGGLNHIFPPENSRLAEEIASGFGAVISEFPPDHPSLPGNFPARNRIISGLSLATLVTEAAEDSGSLITAKLALDQGREVFAIPGPVTSELSKGPLMLIKQGARLVTEAEEILEELGIERFRNKQSFSANKDLGFKNQELELTGVEEKILQHLAAGNKHVDEICRDLGLTAANVSANLIKMEIRGLIKNIGGGNYVKIC